MLFFQETRRQLRADEPMRQKIIPLNAIATVEIGEFVGECRRREFGQTHPVRIIVIEIAPRAAVEGFTITERTLTVEMSNEVALPHHIVARRCTIAASSTAERICAAFKASTLLVRRR